MNKTLLTLLITSIILSNLSFADRRQSAEIVFEKDKSETVDTYAIVRKYTEGVFTKFKIHLDLLASGQAKKFDLGKAPKDFYKYFASSYLLCSTEKGVCPEFLKTILEIDLINSKISGKASCPHTLRMWKSWLGNDMEKRLNHRLKITHMQKVDEFNKTERRQYYKCRNTIEDIIENGEESPGEFFKKRYDENFKSNNYVDKAYEFLKKKRSKKVDIYAEIGLE